MTRQTCRTCGHPVETGHDWAIRYQLGPDGERCRLCCERNYTLEIPIDREQCGSCKQWFDFAKDTPHKERPVRHYTPMWAFCRPCYEKNVEIWRAKAKPVESAYCDNDWEGLQGPDFGTPWDRGLYRG